MAHHDSSPLAPGTLFTGRYVIEKLLRAGGMGSVFAARHTETDRRVALKTMRPSLVPDAGARERFEREAKITASLKSEHIVKVQDAGVDRETRLPFLVMELLEGADLGQVLRDRGALPPVEVLGYLMQVCHALDEAHAHVDEHGRQKCIVHRDLKPENLFLTHDDGGAPRIKLLDFGLAKLVEEGPGATTGNWGTPCYMPYEQIRGADIDHRADLFALGHVTFTLLAGEHYETIRAGGGQDGASARAAVVGVELPRAFDAWFARATAFERSERFDSAADLVFELETAFEAPSTTAKTLKSLERPVPRDYERESTPGLSRPTPGVRWVAPAARGAAVVGGTGLVVAAAVLFGLFGVKRLGSDESGESRGSAALPRRATAAPATRRGFEVAASKEAGTPGAGASRSAVGATTPPKRERATGRVGTAVASHGGSVVAPRTTGEALRTAPITAEPAEPLATSFRSAAAPPPLETTIAAPRAPTATAALPAIAEPPGSSNAAAPRVPTKTPAESAVDPSDIY